MTHSHRPTRPDSTELFCRVVYGRCELAITLRVHLITAQSADMTGVSMQPGVGWGGEIAPMWKFQGLEELGSQTGRSLC